MLNVHQGQSLAQRLLNSPSAATVDAPYRLARIVARVLLSKHLRQRRKWCNLARELGADAAIEERLVHQAIGWLKHGRHAETPRLPS